MQARQQRGKEISNENERKKKIKEKRRLIRILSLGENVTGRII